jgi:hypothetical protein
MKAQNNLVAGSPRTNTMPEREALGKLPSPLRDRQGFRLLGQFPQLHQERLVVIGVVIAFDQGLVVSVEPSHRK